MKRYEYIYCSELKKYDNWEIVKIIEGEAVDRAVIMKEDKSCINYIKLHEATKEQLLEELSKRMVEKASDGNE